MASIRDSMGNKWWADMYNRYSYHDPSNQHYGHYPTSGLNQPLFIEANKNVAIQLSRYCNGVCAYDIGAVTPMNRQTFQAMNECSDNTGAPYICAAGYLGAKKQIRGSPRYDRVG
jgi:hypothetical protein